jgi:hypothetical protein
MSEMVSNTAQILEFRFLDFRISIDSHIFSSKFRVFFIQFLISNPSLACDSNFNNFTHIFTIIHELTRYIENCVFTIATNGSQQGYHVTKPKEKLNA